MTLRFAHAMIQVRNLNESISFYRRALNLVVVERHEYDGASLAYLRASEGGAELELLSEQPWAYAQHPEKGRSHIAFTTVSLEAEHARLTALGLSPSPITPHHANGKLQTRFFYFYDPEGNEIEILEAIGRYKQEADS